jgi:hypothetical protein
LANVQPQFDGFHDAIRLRRFVENQTLREKRDILRSRLNEQLPGVFEAHGEACPTFYFCDQGSYPIGTGTKPLNGDYDIDQGLYFELSTTDYADPVLLKIRVAEALYGHTHDVRIRRPCVTVFYQQDNEPIYHVDVAVYSAGSCNWDGKDRLARGKANSATEFRIWDVSNPQAVVDLIFDRFSGNDRRQFRRVVRYLKRWKDERFSSDGYEAPLGIGLTVLAYWYLQPSYADIVAGKPNDLLALQSVVGGTLNRFSTEWDPNEQTWVRRLHVELPVEPWNDLFAQMTNRQMTAFELKLTQLRDALASASTAVDPVEACETLRKVLGPDFPVPAKEDTGKRYPRAIVSSSNSA